MRISFVCLIVLFCSLTNVFADSEQSQYPYITTSQGGRCFFFMKSDPNDIYNRQKGTGICYEITNNGEFKELWRTEGWYSFRTFLVWASEGERPIRQHLYLVRMGNWHRGNKLSEDDLAVAFYKDGKLLKSYSTVDLIHDKSKVEKSVSHYQYLDDRYEPKLEYNLIKNQRIFKLVTVDGIHYQFDVKTGKYLKQSQVLN